MGIESKGGTKVVEEEISKLSKVDIEFLMNVIKNGMIPGKHIDLATKIIKKLKTQYALLNKSKKEVNKVLSKYTKEKDGELWVEN
jgi:hypothetical protein|tara:strand:- start:1152 stop:1406 length:255 start_codon:yes stop_codon:yes gene_type:complete